jgi:hypothetical protein
LACISWLEYVIFEHDNLRTSHCWFAYLSSNYKCLFSNWPNLLWNLLWHWFAWFIWATSCVSVLNLTNF